MKKLVFVLLLTLVSLNRGNASLIDEKSQTMCNEVWWNIVILKVDDTKINCNINWKYISIDSLDDKYKKYISWVMIKYSTEYKYSYSSKWNNYLEFFAKDIEDLKTFRNWNLTKEVQEKIDEDLKVYEDLYEFKFIKSQIWNKIALKVEQGLSNFESKVYIKNADLFYKNLQAKLKAKIEELEYTLTIARFTQDWYKQFMLKLNIYRYLEKIVEWRME